MVKSYYKFITAKLYEMSFHPIYRLVENLHFSNVTSLLHVNIHKCQQLYLPPPLPAKLEADQATSLCISAPFSSSISLFLLLGIAISCRFHSWTSLRAQSDLPMSFMLQQCCGVCRLGWRVLQCYPTFINQCFNFSPPKINIVYKNETKRTRQFILLLICVRIFITYI